MLGVCDGATALINRAHTRTDNLNLTNIWDSVTPADNQSFWMNDANRLQNASGPWGDKTFYYDGVGNRTYEITTLSGATVTDQYGYAGTDNRLVTVTRAGVTIRGFTYDGGGNILTDSRAGTSYAYTYNNRNRLATVTVGGNLRGTYTYNGLEQVAIRVMTNQTPSGTVHSLYDRGGNLLAETDGSGAAGTMREYIWLPGAEIAPTFGSRTSVDRPVAVVSDITTSPVLYWVHVDHLHRPIKMTNAAKASVWDATWKPWGEPHSLTGTASLDARFPGQWFQIEAGFHYNWHRHYDPTIGRYTQPDPLGFVDGPSVYGYARGTPANHVDPEGQRIKQLFCKLFASACKNIKIDGPSPGFYHGNGRVCQIRYKDQPIFRLDYAAIEGGRNQQSRLHFHVPPNMKKHYSIDPRSLRD